jgi:hypothetical protein
MKRHPTEDRSVPTVEPNSKIGFPALIGAMFDGYIGSFEHRGFLIQRANDSIIVNDLGRTFRTGLGGRLYIKAASVASAMDWINLKIDHYSQ